MSDLDSRALEAQFLDQFLANWEDAIEDEAEDRRRQQRRTFPYVQSIAPLANGEPPRSSEFRNVRCRDISGSGFSFVVNEEPTFKNLVVVFGSRPNMLYMKAAVVHVTSHDAGGKTQYVVGCRYEGRMPADQVQLPRNAEAPTAAQLRQPMPAEAATDIRPRGQR